LITTNMGFFYKIDKYKKDYNKSILLFT